MCLQYHSFQQRKLLRTPTIFFNQYSPRLFLKFEPFDKMLSLLAQGCDLGPTLYGFTEETN